MNNEPSNSGCGPTPAATAFLVLFFLVWLACGGPEELASRFKD